MVIPILQAVIFGSYGLSTLITVLNNSSSNSRIKRKGNVIKPITTNSLTENIKYFVKDYGFLFLPVYNLIKSIKQTAQNDADFDAAKISRLTDRDRIIPPKTEEEKKATTPTKKEEPEKKEEPTKKSPAKARVKTVAEMDCYERREYYRKEYYRLKDLHATSKAAGKSVAELNIIANRMKVIVSEYTKADNECKIEDLKTEKNIILSSMGKQKILVRK